MFALVFPVALAGPFATLSGGLAMTAVDEFAIGKSASQSRVWIEGRWENVDQQRRVETIVGGLLAVSDRPDMVLNVTLVNSAEINASAYPGGFLVVNRGTLEKLNDAQLAFVLGHELAHAELRHGVNALNLASAAKTATSLTAAQAAGDRETAVRQAQELRLLTSGFSRQQELEADVYGLLFMTRAGWDGQAAIDAMGILRTEFGGEIPPLYRAYADHPTFSDRIRELQLGQETIRTVVRQFDAGVTALQAGRSEPAVEAFQSYLTIFPHSTAGWANLAAAWSLQVPDSSPWFTVLPFYVSAETTVRADATLARDRSFDAIDHALKLDPTDPVALGVAGILALRGGDPESARSLFDGAVEASGGDPILVLNRGVAEATLGDEASAIADWDTVLAADPEFQEAHANLGLAYESRRRTRKKAITAWSALLGDADWASEAAKHLVALGVKVEVPPPPPAPTLEALSVNGRTLALGEGVDAIRAALGDPIVRYAASEGELLAWDDLTILLDHDTVRMIGFRGAFAGQTTSGVALGQSLADVQGRLGPESRLDHYGPASLVGWDARGVEIWVRNDRVLSILLTRDTP